MRIVGKNESFHVTIGAEDFTPEQDVEEVRQIEKQIKRRFAIGTQVRQNGWVVFKRKLSTVRFLEEGKTW